MLNNQYVPAKVFPPLISPKWRGYNGIQQGSGLLHNRKVSFDLFECPPERKSHIQEEYFNLIPIQEIPLYLLYDPTDQMFLKIETFLHTKPKYLQNDYIWINDMTVVVTLLNIEDGLLGR
jgi:hypothetical protein